MLGWAFGGGLNLLSAAAWLPLAGLLFRRTTRAVRGRTACFFLPAEDGIRDHCVTGVQTCALPIFMLAGVVTNSRFPEQWGTQNASVDFFRSEERRVRTECRSACVLYARQHKN